MQQVDGRLRKHLISLLIVMLFLFWYMLLVSSLSFILHNFKFIVIHSINNQLHIPTQTHNTTFNNASLHFSSSP